MKKLEINRNDIIEQARQLIVACAAFLAWVDTPFIFIYALFGFPLSIYVFTKTKKDKNENMPKKFFILSMIGHACGFLFFRIVIGM
ncbi:hypothetical protein [Sulfurospirillum oryzae]|uniref:hypothetical protein n=1 Tax=Sulfurospirillum oryzae TaxID=2976535 RepID=UPI0021E91AE8|nr:hypothetical protein [Sulfurospirillum oryzae]